MFIIPKVNIPELSAHWPLRQITFWTAAHIFRIKRDLVYTGSGSGDKTFDWVLAFCLIVIAAVITCVWSVLDRRRPNYVTFHKWFRLAMRFMLASEMFLYGLAKAIPLQMPFLFLRDCWNLTVISLPWRCSGHRLELHVPMRSLPVARKLWAAFCFWLRAPQLLARSYAWRT
ncbi:MAG TPA: hypothetical protein VGK21_18730 [Candidatus Angelobacter sp.]